MSDELDDQVEEPASDHVADIVRDHDREEDSASISLSTSSPNRAIDTETENLLPPEQRMQKLKDELIRRWTSQTLGTDSNRPQYESDGEDYVENAFQHWGWTAADPGNAFDVLEPDGNGGEHEFVDCYDWDPGGECDATAKEIVVDLTGPAFRGV